MSRHAGSLPALRSIDMPELNLPEALLDQLAHADELLQASKAKAMLHGEAVAALDAATTAEQQALAVAAVAAQEATVAASAALEALKAYFGLTAHGKGWRKL